MTLIVGVSAIMGLGWWKPRQALSQPSQHAEAASTANRESGRPPATTPPASKTPEESVPNEKPPSTEAETSSTERKGMGEDQSVDPRVTSRTESSPANIIAHQAPVPPIHRVVVADRSETLYQVALDNYGESTPMIVDYIVLHNPQFKNRDAIVATGQRLVLPDLPESTAKTPTSQRKAGGSRYRTRPRRNKWS